MYAINLTEAWRKTGFTFRGTWPSRLIKIIFSVITVPPQASTKSLWLDPEAATKHLAKKDASTLKYSIYFYP
ncbi:MAG: hypothetical protein CL797_01495 [Chromatiales bacterium]|jgi:hypothetical protein|nr:hypothetical protein [Chromatiales bacterium]